MKVEIFETRILEPMDEENWLTNGKTYSKRVILGKEADIEEWKEVTNEEYLEAQENQEK